MYVNVGSGEAINIEGMAEPILFRQNEADRHERRRQEPPSEGKSVFSTSRGSHEASKFKDMFSPSCLTCYRRDRCFETAILG